MARTRRIKNTDEGETVYHLMSRSNNRRFMFGTDWLKDEMVRLLRRTAAFSGISVLAYAAMDNHFHVVVRVRRRAEPADEELVVRRVRLLRGDRVADRLAGRWRRLRDDGRADEAEAEVDAWRARMNDISQYMKTFKEEYTRFFKRELGSYCGSIWSGRFASTLVEPGDSLRRCVRYVLYNAVRAKIVRQAKDYRWAWCAGTGPADVDAAGPGEAACLQVTVQFGAGKILGEAEFVRRMIAAHSEKFRARSVAAHAVGDFAYSSHGWRLVKVAGR